jgi:hypothetical protein
VNFYDYESFGLKNVTNLKVVGEGIPEIIFNAATGMLNT